MLRNIPSWIEGWGWEQVNRTISVTRAEINAGTKKGMAETRNRMTSKIRSQHAGLPGAAISTLDVDRRRGRRPGKRAGPVRLAIAQPLHTPAISSGSIHAHAAPAAQLALCSEEKPHHCHRRLVAEYFKEKWENVLIEHVL
jgi:hypothetical protein